MTTFREQPFSRRFAQMGDAAEAKCEEVLTSLGIAWDRFGFNRPPIDMTRLDPFVRYTPDYVTSAHLVEAQGFGADGVAKFKRDKLAALTDWNRYMPVQFFLWWSKRRKWAFVPLDDVTKAIDSPDLCTLGHFDGSKAYFGLDGGGLADWRKFSDLNAA